MSKYICAMFFFVTLSYAVSVCIDPGHGGTDSGASGPSYLEKNANLEVALAARTYLLTVSGVTVGMTRSTDATLSLSERCEFANAGGYTRFMSMHENAFNTLVQGTETYCHSTLPEVSVAFRNAVHPWLIWAHSYTNRGVKSADYYVLRNTSMPSILGEGTFIDYTDSWDESWRYATNYNDHKGRQAYAYCAGFCDHMGLVAPVYSSSGTPTYLATYRVSSYSSTMTSGSTQTAWIEYINTGTAIWKPDSTFLTTCLPRGHESVFYTEGNWFSHSGASGVDYNTTEGDTGRFTFIMTAPIVSVPTTYNEFWTLYDFRHTYFGPTDGAVSFRVTVYPESFGAYDSTIVDNSEAAPRYVEHGSFYAGSNPGGWLDNYRWASTDDTEDYATFDPQFSTSRSCDIYTWYVSGTNRATNVAYIISTTTGAETIRVNQTANGSHWNHLGAFSIPAGGVVRVSDIGADVAKVIITDAVKFVSLRSLSIAQQQDTKRVNLISAYPNPFNSSVNITAPSEAQISIFDVSGKQIASLEKEHIWHPSPNTAAGIYFARISTNGTTYQARVLYLK